MKSMLISFITLCVVLYLGLGLLFYLVQGSFIYYPTPENTQLRLDVRTFLHQGERIRVFVLNPGKDKALIYFGGNAGSVEYIAPGLTQGLPHYTTYLVNYRGYGGSTGTPSESALYADALYLYDEILKDHQTISVIGRSLGSGVSTYLAIHRKIEKMVLATPFDSIERIAGKRFPVYPVSLLLREKYDSISRAGQIEAPTLILIAEHDQVITPDHSHNLAKAFADGKAQVRTLPQTGHDNIQDSPLYYEAIIRFIQ